MAQLGFELTLFDFPLQIFFPEGSTDDWRLTFDVNVIAMCICTREAVKTMRENGIAGHIINLNSVVGRYPVCLPTPNLNVYPASKYAVTALTENMRQELRYFNTGIKVTVCNVKSRNVSVYF